jgi:hypothetical protein
VRNAKKKRYLALKEYVGPDCPCGIEDRIREMHGVLDVAINLFADDVGRTDFYGRDRLEEITGLLYESLFHKILPLGDEVIVCPAHGTGSVCGTAIADRTWTTIGLERKHDPKLRYTDKADFAARRADAGVPALFLDDGKAEPGLFAGIKSSRSYGR